MAKATEKMAALITGRVGQTVRGPHCNSRHGARGPQEPDEQASLTEHLNPESGRWPGALSAQWLTFTAVI